MSNKIKNYLPVETLKKDASLNSITENLAGKNLISTPTSSALYRTTQALSLSASADRDNLEKRLKEHKLIGGYKQDITLEIQDNNIAISYETDKELVKVNLETGLTQRTGKTAHKFFRLLMTLANNSPNKYSILVNSKDLVEITNYSRPSTLNRAFDSVIQPLRKIGMSYSKKNKATGKFERTAEMPYFTLLAREGNNITIKLNPELDLEGIFNFWTVYKPTSFQLPDNAFVLYDNIMYLARQKTSKVGTYEINGDKVEGLRFNMSMRDVVSCMSLPIFNPTNPKTQIKDPIDRALDDIEKNDSEIYVSIKGVDDDCRIEEYLANGYLEITLTGDYADHFKCLGKKKKSQIDKRNRLVEKAQQKVIEDSIRNTKKGN